MRARPLCLEPRKPRRSRLPRPRRTPVALKPDSTPPIPARLPLGVRSAANAGGALRPSLPTRATRFRTLHCRWRYLPDKCAPRRANGSAARAECGCVRRGGLASSSYDVAVSAGAKNTRTSSSSLMSKKRCSTAPGTKITLPAFTTCSSGPTRMRARPRTT